MKKYFELTKANDNGQTTFGFTTEGEEIFDKIIENEKVSRIIVAIFFFPCLILFVVRKTFTFLKRI